MDLQDQRMQCLKMAFELGGDTERVLTAAQRMLDFVAGAAQPAVTVAEPASPEPAAEPASVMEEKPEAPAAAVAETVVAEAVITEAVAADVVADPIAACGTALVMPESGNLADALPSPETVEAVADPAPAAESTVETAPAAEAAGEVIAAEEAAAPAEAPAADVAASLKRHRLKRLRPKLLSWKRLLPNRPWPRPHRKRQSKRLVKSLRWERLQSKWLLRRLLRRMHLRKLLPPK